MMPGWAVSSVACDARRRFCVAGSAAVLAALLLSGCAASYVPVAGGAVDETQLERDRAACEAEAKQRDPLADTALSFLGAAAWGAAEGVGIGLIHSGVGTGEGAAVGAGVGAVAGLIYGIAAGNQDVEAVMEGCMRRKGYRVE